MKAAFGGGARKHEIQCSTQQMAVLMLFNDAESLGYGEIEAACGIPEDELKRVLQSLACVKVGGCWCAPRCWVAGLEALPCCLRCPERGAA